MTVTKPGAIMKYENVIYGIGEWLQVRVHPIYSGLSGLIVELTNKGNELDIICKLMSPTEPVEIAALEERFSQYCDEPKCLSDVPLDAVLLHPEQIRFKAEEPVCYNPEKDTPYPLCVGNGSQYCAHCVYQGIHNHNEHE